MPALLIRAENGPKILSYHLEQAIAVIISAMSPAEGFSQTYYSFSRYFVSPSSIGDYLPASSSTTKMPSQVFRVDKSSIV